MLSLGQKTKTLEKDNVKIEYPAEWVNRDLPGYYILVSEPPKEQMSVMTTFDVAVEEGSKNLKEYCEEYENKMAANEQYKNYTLKSKKEIDFKGMDAIEYNCTATVSSLPVEWKSIVFIKNGKIYKLSTTSLIGQFYLKKEITEKIFESFEIKSTANDG